jgi:DNA ligase (NAD+)
MINPPKVCPSCQSELVFIEDQLFCKNKQCPAQTVKKLEHFAKVLKIKGLGPKTLEKLGFEEVADLYDFNELYYINTLGDKVGRKVFTEVENSKLADLATLLEAFSIPLVGNTASLKIAGVVSSIEEINENTCKTAGLGPTVTANLLNWLQTKEFSLLPFSFTSSAKQRNKNSSLPTVCITGKLQEFSNRDSAKKYLESLGFSVVDSVTKTTNVLVDEEGKESSKRKKAEQLGIEILSIKQLTERYK